MRVPEDAEERCLWRHAAAASLILLIFTLLSYCKNSP